MAISVVTFYREFTVCIASTFSLEGEHFDVRTLQCNTETDTTTTNNNNNNNYELSIHTTNDTIFFNQLSVRELMDSFKGLGGFQKFNFFCPFNNTICLEYSTIWCWNRRLYVS